jgi:hypothetical protein
MNSVRVHKSFELTDTRPDVAAQESEYKRLLGYPRDQE